MEVRLHADQAQSSVTESSVTESSISRFSLVSTVSPLFSHVTRFMGYYFMCVYWPDLLKATWKCVCMGHKPEYACSFFGPSYKVKNPALLPV